MYQCSVLPAKLRAKAKLMLVYKATEAFAPTIQSFIKILQCNIISFTGDFHAFRQNA